MLRPISFSGYYFFNDASIRSRELNRAKKGHSFIHRDFEVPTDERINNLSENSRTKIKAMPGAAGYYAVIPDKADTYMNQQYRISDNTGETSAEKAAAYKNAPKPWF